MLCDGSILNKAMNCGDLTIMVFCNCELPTEVAPTRYSGRRSYLVCTHSMYGAATSKFDCIQKSVCIHHMQDAYTL